MEPSLAMKYSIGTIVSDWHQYDTMQKSFFDAGFSQSDCQYLPINNVGKNRFCMYSGGNAIIRQALGDYIILAHQDVRINQDNREDLDERISELELAYSTWAVAGNAGEDNGEWYVRITDPYGKDQRSSPYFPHRVNILDGNFLVVKKSSLVSFSVNLHGFHYYGWDICLNADVLGYRSYIIDFHIEHLGSGNVNENFFQCKDAFEKKWSHALRERSLGAFHHDQLKINYKGN
jgi:hypothetical protein